MMTENGAATPRKENHMAKKKKQMQITREQQKQKELTDTEKKRVEAFLATRKEKPGRLKWNANGKSKSGKPILTNDLEKGKSFVLSALGAATGSVDLDFAGNVINQAMNATLHISDDPADHANAVTAAMTGIAPKDELEGLLCAQMVSAHNQAMDCLRRANIKDQTFEGRRLNLIFADRFMRTFAVQVEALTRYRKGGQQKVILEHVHVYQGGQAIVGTVNHGAEKADPGRGDDRGKDGTTG